MSKSKKNVVDPEYIINNYGADSVRLFILSDSPPEKDVQWSEQGMVSSYKFIQKLWIMHNQIKSKILNEGNDYLDEELEKYTNNLIAKITNNLERFNYNVIIANMYETYNYLVNFIKDKRNLKNLEENYKKILVCFSPVIPHFSSECLSHISINEEFRWPEFDKSILDTEEVKFVIQINGRKRAILKVKKDISEHEILKLAKNDKNIDKYLNNVEINKVIFVKNRLINILVNE